MIRAARLVAIADTNRALADEAAARFGIPLVFDSSEALIAHDRLDLIDVCTPSSTHFDLSWAALESGRHVLCEKPVAFDYRETRRAAELARSKRLKTKLGFTFRYAPAVRYMRQLVADGFVGTPFIFNGYEQNSQWLDPMNPLRQVDPDADPTACMSPRSKATARRSSTSRTCWWAATSRRSSARCVTSFRTAWSAPPADDAADEHR